MTPARARGVSVPTIVALTLFAAIALALQATPAHPARQSQAAASLLPADLASHDLALLMTAGAPSRINFHAISSADVDGALRSTGTTGTPVRRFGVFAGDGGLGGLLMRRRLLSGVPFGGILAAAGDRNHVDSLLLASLVAAESQFSPHVVSNCGAVGLMQLLPATAKEYGAKDPTDPYANVDAGSRYLRALLDRFKERPVLAIAAYNTGPEVVARYGCVPPFRETQDFVRRVLTGYADRCRGLDRGETGAEPGLLVAPDRIAGLASPHTRARL